MEICINPAEKMTPVERKQAIEDGKAYDRIRCIPAMGELKSQIGGQTIWDMWHDPRKIAEIEVSAFNRFGHDQMMIGPNSYGIADALGADVIYAEDKLPYIGKNCLKDYQELSSYEPLDAKKDDRIKTFLNAAELLADCAAPYVPITASVGGPMTIASYLRGVEYLLRDCKRQPEQVHRLLRLVTDSEKSCIKAMGKYGFSIAMADPVANPELIGPKYYKEFAYPYMKELTDYAYEVTGKKANLHMCGRTYSIWKYFSQLNVQFLSLDNAIDLNRAKEELAPYLAIAGNVPPVEVVMSGTKEEIFQSVQECARIGKQMQQGYVLSTGCEIPYGTALSQIDLFMEAARQYG